MKSTSSICLLPKGIVKPNSMLKLNKQNLIQKVSLHLTPIIINTTPSKASKSNQKRLKVLITQNRKSLKLNNQESKNLSTQMNAFKTFQIKNTNTNKAVEKNQYHLSNRSISKKLQLVNKGCKVITLNRNINEEIIQKQCKNICSKLSIKERTQKNNQIAIEQSMIDDMAVKYGLQNRQRQQFYTTDNNLFEKTVNLEDLSQKDQSINLAKPKYSNQEFMQQEIISKNQSSSIDLKNHKLLTIESNIVEYTLSLSCGCGVALDSSQIIREKTDKELLNLDQALNQQNKLIDQSKENYSYLQSQIDKKQLQLQQLQLKLNHLRGKITNLESQYDQIINFSCNQEKNKILKMISKDYLQLQAEIYDYAAYLQSNQLANDLHFEPKPFSEIEKLILQRQTELKDSLLKNGKNITENFILMTDFISETMRLLKNKDTEMQNLSSFRVKCVQEFITKMKKWINNWELKQEYLKNLKLEFLATSTLLKNSFCALQEEICEKELSLSKMNKITTINQLIEKMELNFKLGNSFY